MGRYISSTLKEFIIQRAEGRCEYCKSLMKNAIHTFHIDHIVPVEKDGLTESDNLALACGGCNSAKGIETHNLDSLSGQFVPLFNPRIEKWNTHFSWSADYLEMIGDSPTGRATIIKLRLNRKGLTNMRRLTLLIGEHPPTQI